MSLLGLQNTRRCMLRYIRGSQAQNTGSAVDLLETYLSETECGLAHAANLPVSQRYFYESKRDQMSCNKSSTSHKERSRNSNHMHRGIADLPEEAEHCNDSHARKYEYGIRGLHVYNSEQYVSPRHNAIQLRLGHAQLLSSTRHAALSNVNEAHPLYFAQTSPRLAGLCVPLIMTLRQLRIHKLTELQGALIPIMLRGKHVKAHAETGSGKSFGIALAIANRILRDNLNYRLHTIILVPTEELAWQYEKWFCHFGNGTAQIVQVAVNSIPLEQQLAKLHNIAPHILVGTPSRVAEINRLSRSILGERLRRKVDCVVLDEADLILNMSMSYGYQQISGKELIDKLFRVHIDEVPAQMVAASATIDGSTAKTLNTWTRNDKAIRLTTSFVEHTIPSSISFYFFAAAPLPRYNLLYCLELLLCLILHQTKHARILLFTLEEHIDHVVECINTLQFTTCKESLSNEHFPLAMALHENLCTESSSVCLHSRRDREGNNELKQMKNTNSASSSINKSQSISYNYNEEEEEQKEEYKERKKKKEKEDYIEKSTLFSSYSEDVRSSSEPTYINNSNALSLFNNGKITVGVAPHSLGRGLHVSNVTHVILFGEFTAELARSNTFVHCAGRTGRMGQEGDVIVLYPPSSGRLIKQMCNSLEIPFVPHKINSIEELLPVNSSYSLSSSSSPSSCSCCQMHEITDKNAEHSTYCEHKDNCANEEVTANISSYPREENTVKEIGKEVKSSMLSDFGSASSLSVLDAHNAKLNAIDEAVQMNGFLNEQT